ncbi:MAG: hypothetical protein R3325_00640 [Thermoanaerobaculia bacterium]|nr:hypothetical protein [Thermoanaerobaculia bacterium]
MARPRVAAATTAPRLRRRVALGLLLPLLVAPLAAVASNPPAWFDEIQVFTGKGQAEAPFTGVPWGFSPHNEREFFINGVEHWQARGGIYHGSVQFENAWMEFPTDPELAALDIDGDPIPSPSGFAPNLHHPGYYDQLLEWGKLAADLGAGGMHVDGYFGNARVVEGKPGGSFDPFTMEDFRAHLEGEYTPAQLRAFGIPDIGTFDYGAWIRQRGLEQSWNDFPLAGLAAAFYIYEYQYAKQFYSRFRDDLRDYAAREHGIDYLVTDNVAEWIFHTTDVSDFVISEFFYFKLGSRRETDLAASLVKMARAAADTPIVVLPEILRSRPRAVPPDKPRNLMRFVLADVYGAGGQVIYNEGDILRLDEKSGDYIRSIRPNFRAVVEVNSFILDNPDLYEDLEPLARVAVVYSSASHFNQRLALEGLSEAPPHLYGYWGLSKLLIGANIQHEVVFLPDARFAPDRVKLRDFKPYDVIVVENAFAMSARQVRALLKYVKRGGRVIAMESVGTHDERGRPASRGQLRSLTTPGVNELGAGAVEYLAEPLGLRYNAAGARSVRDGLTQRVRAVAGDLTRVTGASKVSVFAYRKRGTQERVVHVVNYDYDPTRDRFRRKKKIEIEIEMPEGEYEVTWVRPGDAAGEELKAKWTGGYVQVTVPVLTSYGVLRVAPAQ